jgi:hypothetical protein
VGGNPHQRIEVVAADPPQDAREVADDLVAVSADDLAHGAVNGRLQGSAGAAALPLLGRQRAERGPAAVAQHHAQRADVVDRLAVDDGARAGRVVADHPAEVGAAGRRDVGAELQAVPRQGAVEGVQDHAGLDARGPADGVDGQDGVEVLAAVEDDAGADGLARQAGTPAARGDRHAHLAGDLDRGDEVVGRARDDDAERLDLVDAGVGAVEAARQGVEADLAGQVLAQVAGQGFALQVGECGHGVIVPAGGKAGKTAAGRLVIMERFGRLDQGRMWCFPPADLVGRLPCSSTAP